MDVYKKFHDDIALISAELGLVDNSGLVVEPVKDFKRGDIATNLAMLIARLKKKLHWRFLKI